MWVIVFYIRGTPAEEARQSGWFALKMSGGSNRGDRRAKPLSGEHNEAALCCLMNYLLTYFCSLLYLLIISFQFKEQLKQGWRKDEKYVFITKAPLMSSKKKCSELKLWSLKIQFKPSLKNNSLKTALPVAKSSSFSLFTLPPKC